MEYSERIKLLRDISFLNNDSEMVADLEILDHSDDLKFKIKYLNSKKAYMRTRLKRKQKVINISLRLLDMCDNG